MKTTSRIIPTLLSIPAKAGIQLLLAAALVLGAAQVGFGQVEVEWARGYPQSGGAGQSLLFSQDGVDLLSTSQSGIYISRISKEGEFQGNVYLGDDEYGRMPVMGVSGNGGHFYLAGWGHVSKIDINGNIAASQNFTYQQGWATNELNSVAASQNRIVAVGYAQQSNNRAITVGWILILDNDLQLVRSVGIGNNGNESYIFASVCASPDGGFVITGYRYTGETGALLALIKVDQDGQVQWQRTCDIMENRDDFGQDVTCSMSGNILVTAMSDDNPRLYNFILWNSTGDSLARQRVALRGFISSASTTGFIWSFIENGHNINVRRLADDLSSYWELSSNNDSLTPGVSAEGLGCVFLTGGVRGGGPCLIKTTPDPTISPINVPEDCETIQQAIDWATDGDTILVAPGTYTENLVIDGKSISIIGDPEHPENVVIDANGNITAVSFINPETDGTRLEGFTIQNAVMGGWTRGTIWGSDAGNIQLSHLVIWNSDGHALHSWITNFFVDHTTIYTGSNYAVFNASSVALSNSIVRGFNGQLILNGDVSATFSNIQSGFEGEGNIDADPLFLDPDNGDFRLAADSPCIDAGDPNSATDSDGTRADMGAFPVTQTFHRIALRQGWNLISSFNQPRQSDMPDVWSEIVSRGNLYLAKNQSGQFYMPGAFNNMAPWDVRQGYMAKLNEADTLVIVNVPVTGETPIPLRQGWNMVAYFPEAELDVRDAFANIIDDVIIVKNIEGQFFIPARGFSNMALLRRGKGYQANVSRAVELVYPAGERRFSSVTAPSRSASVTPPRVTANGKVSADDGASAEESSHFQPVELTGGNMSLLLNGIWKMENGTGEIGAFTANGLCVGSTGVSAGQTATEGGATVIGLAVWADDPTTPEIDGAVEGEALGFRLWDGQKELNAKFRMKNETPVQQASIAYVQQASLPVIANRQAGTPVVRFETDGFAEGSIAIDSDRSVYPLSFILYPSFPNPFNSTTLIRFDLPEANSVSLIITDLSGREIARLADGNYTAGSHSITWSASNQPSGVYLVKLSTSLGIRTSKVALIR